MTLNKKGTRKKVAGIVLASALVVGSFGSISAFAANGADAVQKNTVITVPATATAVTPDTSSVAQGSIQYTKTVYSRTDGSLNMETEGWYNPETKDLRADTRSYSADQKLLSYGSVYHVNSFNDLITIKRDLNGNPVSGKIATRADDPKTFEFFDSGNQKIDFSNRKEIYQGISWKHIGTEKTPDGKILNKVMESYKSSIDDNTEANIQRIAFLDPDTGLLVKEELYEDSTGQAKLFSTVTSEYKYVKDDGSLFRTDEITLTPVKSYFAAFQK